MGKWYTPYDGCLEDVDVEVDLGLRNRRRIYYWRASRGMEVNTGSECGGPVGERALEVAQTHVRCQRVGGGSGGGGGGGGGVGAGC